MTITQCIHALDDGTCSICADRARGPGATPLDEMIAVALTAPEIVPAVAARDIVLGARASCPGALAAWLDSRAEAVVRAVITELIRRDRAKSRASAGPREFSESARRLQHARQSGDAALAAAEERVGMFTTMFCVSADLVQKRVADMSGPEHEFVADAYEGSANGALMEAAFHRAVAKKVGKRRTADVMTEQQYERLYRSVTAPGRGA